MFLVSRFPLEGDQKMSKSMAINQIEQQIEALPPIEQVMMLERIVRHLKKLLLSQPTITVPKIESGKIVEKLNYIYEVEASRLDSQLVNAQCISLSRDEW
jgi:aspartate carbamoyltransferase regulatory subunit